MVNVASSSAVAASRAAADRTPPAQGTLNASTRVRELAERWFVDVQQEVTEGTKSPNTARRRNTATSWRSISSLT
jgi:hypothetical protein